MVTLNKKFDYLPNGEIDIAQWLNNLENSQRKDFQLIKNVVEFTAQQTKGLTTYYGQSCTEQALTIADILIELQLDNETIIAAILYATCQHTKVSDEVITKLTHPNILKLLRNVEKMQIFSQLNKVQNELQIDRLRKAILAIASDIRAVLIKLAEKTCILRGIKNINPTERHRFAVEILDIYAPLANRLGIGQLKWELEDLAFHYTNTEQYKMIAGFLAERRTDRQNRIHEVIETLKESLKNADIHAEISGRAKHIYSIHLKMQRKYLDYKNIYDASAVRVLVQSIDDCYNTLSIAHKLWQHIPEEFDDYIANPKPNGYRSIHTAVIGPQNKNLEIQIRTFEMHNIAEHGVAAHWVYKENKSAVASYENKVTHLRQLLSWQSDIASEDQQKTLESIFDDAIYVFTPAGDIIDLPTQSTPLDFAYHIHSGLGHRCRGAKINGQIVPLTYQLKMGDKVEIITIPNGTPSRDWLNKDLGYVKNAGTKTKILKWFKLQETTHYIEHGKSMLEKELTKAGLINVDMQKLANKFQFKTTDSLYSTLGHGSIRAAQLVQAALQERHKHLTKTNIPEKQAYFVKESKSGFSVSGVNDLLTRIAKCCKPIPGDEIVGYITQGRGISVHRLDCANILSSENHHENKLISVNWDDHALTSFYVDLQIQANNNANSLREITSVLASNSIPIISLYSSIYKQSDLLQINITIELKNKDQLNKIMNELQKSMHIVSVKRMHSL